VRPAADTERSPTCDTIRAMSTLDYWLYSIGLVLVTTLVIVV
jgi:hypothetical protein